MSAGPTIHAHAKDCTCADCGGPPVHIELTDDDDHDFEPNTFVAYCDGCDAGIAWRTLTPLSDWQTWDGNPEMNIVPVTNPGDVACPGCGERTFLPTLKQLLTEPRFRERLLQLQHEPTLATAFATHGLKN